MKNPFLIGKLVYLRAPEPGDEEIIALSENHPDPRETLYYALPTSSETQRIRITNKQNDPNTIFFSICSIEPDRVVGCTSFVRIDWVGRMTTFYIAISEKENWSKGYGSEATQLMVDYAFDVLNFNRVQLHVSCENDRAVKVYSRIGFQTEGTLRQAMFHHGRYSDFYVMGILKEDWLKKKK